MIMLFFLTASILGTIGTIHIVKNEVLAETEAYKEARALAMAMSCLLGLVSVVAAVIAYDTALNDIADRVKEANARQVQHQEPVKETLDCVCCD